jgi:trk system potassium uptake protein TrkH
MRIGNKHLSSFQVIVYGFSALILVGTLLLMTPLASRNGQWTSFPDALFTSTSAVCVTGLVVRDTATYWSLFGQIVIIGLIQIGGLGIVITAGAIAIVSGRKIGLMQRSTLQDSLSAPKLGGIVRMTGFIVKGVFLIESIGALILMTRFIPAYGISRGIWYSIFHSISAFCNAGFDLMGNFSSLTGWASDPVVSLTIAFLIIIGGIGFLTWNDFYQHRFHFRRYSLQSKLILVVTSAMILLPTLYFYFFEFSSYHGLTRLLVSFFQAVTPRTAGFNTVDLTSLSETGILLMIFLMIIGGSPGSTAGGMKTTTLGVLILTSRSILRKEDKPEVYNRTIGASTAANALTIAMMYLTLFTISGCIISRLEGLPLLTCLFETASAVGTVGLTLGITTSLCLVSRMILTALMFIGRIGGLTMVYAFLANAHPKHAHCVEEKIIVG